jgi:predicted ribosome quality control (RQC) complex YloA/Tae2 family protein
MKILCQELQERALGFQVSHCLPNDKRRFFLVLRKHPHQETLFFCFQPPFIRFHFVQSAVPKDSSSHPLLAPLKQATLTEASLPYQDRILQLTFETPLGERKLLAEFFSKHPNYYLLDAQDTLLFALHPLAQSHYHPPPPRAFKQEDTLLGRSHREVELVYAQFEQEWVFAREKQALQTHLSQQLKKLQRKEQELQHSLNECVEWEKVQHEGELIKAHFARIPKGTSLISVWDWLTEQPYQLEMDSTQTVQEALAARFRRAKKLQAGIQPLTHQLERTQTHMQRIRQQQQQLDSITTHASLATFKAQHVSAPSSTDRSSQSPAVSLPYREYCSAAGIKIWVGKNAKDNEKLTFQLAHGRDWWLHVTGYAGSHVVIRMNKDQKPDVETLEDAMQLALYYSKAREQKEAEICVAQRKYVSRAGKGKTGRVQISKHQTVWVRFDADRYRTLKERSAFLYDK